MRVTTKKILTFNPCKDRINNFIEHYGNDYDDLVVNFIEKIT